MLLSTNSVKDNAYRHVIRTFCLCLHWYLIPTASSSLTAISDRKFTLYPVNGISIIGLSGTLPNYGTLEETIVPCIVVCYVLECWSRTNQILWESSTRCGRVMTSCLSQVVSLHTLCVPLLIRHSKHWHPRCISALGAISHEGKAISTYI